MPRTYTVRKSPYLVSLFFLLAATTLTLLNVHTADLIHVIVRSPGPLIFETKYGLYRRCTRSQPLPNAAFLLPSQPLPLSSTESLSEYTTSPPYPIDTEGSNWQCQPFPTRSECSQFGEKFCVLWSTAGYAAQSSLVPCFISLISLMFIFLYRGKKSKRAKARRQQWKLVSGSMGIHFVLQALSIGLILWVFKHDERFESKGSHLDQSFEYGVASAVLSLTTVLILTFTALSARAGQQWAAGKSARQARRHRRTRSGRVVPVPEGVEVPEEQVVTVAEVVQAGVVDERTSLLSGGEEGRAAGGGEGRATDEIV